MRVGRDHHRADGLMGEGRQGNGEACRSLSPYGPEVHKAIAAELRKRPILPTDRSKATWLSSPMNLTAQRFSSNGMGQQSSFPIILPN